MKTTDFHFDLPPELIAQAPLAARRDSRLLLVDGYVGTYSDQNFTDICTLIKPGDLLVFNDTRVIPARLFGEKKNTGGKIELLVERIASKNSALCHIKASKSPQAGTALLLAGVAEATVRERRDALFLVELDNGDDFMQLLYAQGSVPLPPYIKREANAEANNAEANSAEANNVEDRARYQTVYADKPGAVAAPTAGLHFDASLIEQLQANGVDTAFVTLHVGAGTFQPVRVDDPDKHVMHAERIEVSESVCEKIAATRARNRRVIAVGTTVVRSLESTVRDGKPRPFSGETAIFIRPPYRFQCVDALLTNFHLPESTLIMLVAAFGGYETIMRAYQHAVESRYRFFSYGDAMFIQPAALSKAEL